MAVEHNMAVVEYNTVSEDNMASEDYNMAPENEMAVRASYNSFGIQHGDRQPGGGGQHGDGGQHGGGVLAFHRVCSKQC